MGMFKTVKDFNGSGGGASFEGQHEVFVDTITEQEFTNSKAWKFVFKKVADNATQDFLMFLNAEGIPYNKRILAQLIATYKEGGEDAEQTLEKLASENFKKTCFVFFTQRFYENKEGKTAYNWEPASITKDELNEEQIIELKENIKKYEDKAKKKPVKKEIKAPAAPSVNKPVDDDDLPF